MRRVKGFDKKRIGETFAVKINRAFVEKYNQCDFHHRYWSFLEDNDVVFIKKVTDNRFSVDGEDWAVLGTSLDFGIPEFFIIDSELEIE